MALNFVALAEQIIAAQMQIVDFEGEIVAFINPETQLIIQRHFFDGQFFGWNVYAQIDGRLELLETYNSKREARAVVTNLKGAMEAGADYYRMPGN